MATANRATLINMRTKLIAMGGVHNAVIGEPKSGVLADGLVAIIPSDGQIDETTLKHPREIHNVTLRRYSNAMREPGEDTEFEMDAWRAEVVEDLMGNFSLGGNVAYIEPTLISWTYRYLQMERVWFRLLDINVGYRIDDNAAFVK